MAATDLPISKHSALASFISRIKELFSGKKSPLLKFKYSGMVRGATIDSKGRRVK
jgi:hypothetical protein